MFTLRQKTNRQLLQQIYGSLYNKFVDPELWVGCYYCGDDLGKYEWDHVPPMEAIDNLDKAEWRRKNQRFWLIRSCPDCNTRLAHSKRWTTLERLEFLEGELTVEFERNSKLWSEDELSEMSLQFQKVIRYKQMLKLDKAARIQHIQKRIVHYETHPEQEP